MFRRFLGGAVDRTPGAERAEMVERQLRSRGISDERVLSAMGIVPRELFVPEHERHEAYADRALPIESGQTISQPYIVARMTELLRTAPGERVLEIGTGSGYQAAVLAEIGCLVTTIERRGDLADSARARLAELAYLDRVEIIVADGSLGMPDAAPWDGILVTAAAPSIPPSLREQLGEGRRLVIPVGGWGLQDLLVVECEGGAWREWSDGACRFVPLLGAAGWEE